MELNPGGFFPAPKVRSLFLRIVPLEASALGADEHVAEFSRMAEIDPSSATNPVALTADNLAGLYHKAIAGELRAG